MSRAARIALVATAVFAVSGFLSGLLIDEYDGIVGAVEWMLRTLVVISAAVALAAAFVLVLRLRRRVRSRPLGWALTAVAAVAFTFFVIQPVMYAVYLTISRHGGRCTRRPCAAIGPPGLRRSDLRFPRPRCQRRPVDEPACALSTGR